MITMIKSIRKSVSNLLGSPAPHPDDEAVDRFAKAMKLKLAKKRADGFKGWHSRAECTDKHLSEMLINCVLKGDPVDVANLAMMLHQRGQMINLQAVRTVITNRTKTEIF